MQCKPYFAAKLLFKHKITLSYAQLIRQCTDCGIQEVFVLEDLFSDQDFQEAIRDSGLKLSLIVQTLFPGATSSPKGAPRLAILADGSEARAGGHGDWYSMLCPHGGRQGADPVGTLISRILKLIQRFPPYGINLDFIRYFVFWEAVREGTDPQSLPQSCFCPRCTNRFSQQFSVRLPEGLSVSETAGWILERHQEKWTSFKTTTISALVRRITSELSAGLAVPHFKLHAVPWLREDFDNARERIAGQDIGALSQLVEAISPMCYSHMLGRGAEWIGQVVSDMAASSNGAHILPAFQAIPMYRDEPFSVRDFAACLEAALLPPSSGVVFWPWESLSQEQLEIISARYQGK
jgi:hypothetical protein